MECHSFIIEQRREEYKDLLHALDVMRIIDTNTPKSQVFLAVWLLHTGNLRYDINLQDGYSFINIVEVFMQFFEDDVDVYWLAKCFYDAIKKYEADIPKLLEASFHLLEKEDDVLYKHLCKHNILYNLSLEKWFDSAFSGILNEVALGKYVFYIISDT